MSDAAIGIAILALAAAGLCLLLRVAKPRQDARDAISAWAILSGLAVATALGPALLGRIDPAMHARLITGVPAGSPEAAALESAEARMRADAVAGAAGPDAAAGLQRAQDAVASAAHAFAQPRRMTAAILGAIVMVLCWPRLRGVGVPHDSEPLHAVAAPTVIAATVAWSVTIPALLAYIAMRMWVGADEVASTCAAAACATGATFPTAAAWRAARRCDGAGGTLVAHAGAWCLPVAACVLVSAIVMMRLGAAGDNGSAGGAPAAAMFAAVGAVCAACACAPLVGRWLAPPDVSEAAPAPSRAWRGATIDALTAATVAITVASIDPFSWDFVWAAAIFALIAEDGRWLAGWAACYLQGTHSSRDAARVGAMLEENSRPMIAVVAAATAIGAMTAQDAALLCAAAWALDLTWGVRRLISVAPARQVPQE